MIFNSLEFLLFACLFFLLWPWLGKRNNSRWGFITAASFFFYGWWDWRFLFLILASGLVDYFAGAYMVRRPERRTLTLVISLIANLGSLAIFKYSAFFATVLEDGFRLLHLEVDLVSRIPEFALILPVGISFYTFQSLSYTIDIYRGRLQPTRNILHFFSYLSMFPQLVAGPIVRATHLMNQLTRYRKPSTAERWGAIKLICYGLFQKTVIADNLAYLIDSAFEGKADYDVTLFWWVVAIAFGFQIYCDFSGYSLIARGLAKYMGYHFRMNFNHPYLSRSLREFWTRWHISLSSWFRDYVYIPLGGSRRGLWRSIVALATTMLLSGLWHGANYTFLAWAGIHIVFLSLERLTKWNKRLRLPRMAFMLIIFLQVTFAWVYFRATDIEQANGILYKMLRFQPSDPDFFRYYANNISVLIGALMIEYMIYLRKTRPVVARLQRQYPVDVALVAISIG
ncbi:MAG: MBOAT family O-acyltransferase, partial [Bacteroidota bacterium]